MRWIRTRLRHAAGSTFTFRAGHGCNRTATNSNDLWNSDGITFSRSASIQPRKNLVRLIKAYESLRRVISSEQLPQLVLAGRRGWLEAETIRRRS
jgi:hypothetical protein